MPAGERDLAVLLASLHPELHPGRYVFALAPDDGLAPDLDVVAMVREAEGLTLVLPASDADRAGLDYDGAMEWITLRVHSALDAVGLTAAFSTALAIAGVSANVIAGLHHDHVFVPAGRGPDALAVLRALSATGSRLGDHPPGHGSRGRAAAMITTRSSTPGRRGDAVRRLPGARESARHDPEPADRSSHAMGGSRSLAVPPWRVRPAIRGQRAIRSALGAVTHAARAGALPKNAGRRERSLARRAALCLGPRDPRVHVGQ